MVRPTQSAFVEATTVSGSAQFEASRRRPRGLSRRQAAGKYAISNLHAQSAERAPGRWQEQDQGDQGHQADSHGEGPQENPPPDPQDASQGVVHAAPGHHG